MKKVIIGSKNKLVMRWIEEGTREHLRRKIYTLHQTIGIGEWREEDQPFVTEQAQKLAGHKRKLNDVNLLARVWQLETNMEAETIGDG